MDASSFASGDAGRYPAMAAELVGRHVDLIVTRGTPSVLAAKNATTTIPIVTLGVPNPGTARGVRFAEHRVRLTDEHVLGDGPSRVPPAAGKPNTARSPGAAVSSTCWLAVLPKNSRASPVGPVGQVGQDRQGAHDLAACMGVMPSVPGQRRVTLVIWARRNSPSS